MQEVSFKFNDKMLACVDEVASMCDDFNGRRFRVEEAPTPTRQLNPQEFRTDHDEIIDIGENIDDTIDEGRNRQIQSGLSVPIQSTLGRIGVLSDDQVESEDFSDGVYKYQFRDGSVYVGEWKNGAIEGKGEMKWADGGFYKGMWINNE